MTIHRVKPGRAVRRAAAVLATALAVGLAAGPASGTHTYGTLDCGSAGVYGVDAASVEPLVVAKKFDTPAPWSLLLLLEDTTRVFRSLYTVTPNWSIYLPAVEHYPGDLVACTLSSTGPNFGSPWQLTGFFVP